jgi:hypothetical protein
MSTDRKIAWLGIGLSALGLVPIFRDAKTQLIVAYCVAFLAVLAFFLYTVYRTSGPQYTTTSLKKELTIHDKDATLASLRREHRIHVNYGSIAEIWCRSIYGNGTPDSTVDNFKVDGKPVPAQDQLLSGNEVDLRMRFSEPVFSGHETTVVWGYDLHKSFPEKHEALEHTVTPGTREVELIVHLPADRLCVKAALHVVVGGETVNQLEDPEISEERKTLHSRVKSPKSGHTLRLSWDW